MRPPNILVLFAIVLMMSGCSNTSKTPTPMIYGDPVSHASINVGDASVRLFTQNGSLFAQWVTNSANTTMTLPASIRQLDSCPVTVTVNSAKGSPVHGAKVAIDLTMPSMSMPDNRVVLKETNKGVYSGTCRFTMAGGWKVRVMLDNPTYNTDDSWLQVNVH